MKTEPDNPTSTMPAVPGAGQVSRHPRRRPGRSSSLRCGRSAWTPTPVSHAQTRPGTAEKQTQPAQLDLTGPTLSGMTQRGAEAVPLPSSTDAPQRYRRAPTSVGTRHPLLHAVDGRADRRLCPQRGSLPRRLVPRALPGVTRGARSPGRAARPYAGRIVIEVRFTRWGTSRRRTRGRRCRERQERWTSPDRQTAAG